MDNRDKIRFGVAYYDEYMPYERLDKDIEMMKKAGINTVRIAESTWSTCEPQEGVFDFSHVVKVMDAMEAAGIDVIIGTPTYAIPSWMEKSYPDILATTASGRRIYGPRQIMDITHPAYRFYGERVIRKLMECTAHRKCVVGFQLDNETKYYGTAGKNVQRQFVKYLRKKFHDDLDAMNKEFGLDYWSNRVDAWEDFPDVRGTINGSLGAEFEKFQRSLVTEYLGWQADIVNEYRREDQFITHNLDFEWRGYSYGVQPFVDHAQVAKCLTVAGCDIYHPSQDDLTGTEIAFGGDLIRCLKNDNYLVLETAAQGFPGWTPYKGQLRLQAYSHIASGADGVEYWHWHSIHNACETYWKGLLSHDFAENATYQEACRIGKEFAELKSHLLGLKKTNEVAILVSNEALTALKWFGIEATASGSLPGDTEYNDVVRWMYDVLYRMNVECDIIWPETEDLSRYKVILTPALYAASDGLLERLKAFVEQGGTLVSTFKTGFANENVKVSYQVQPRILRDCMGVRYHQFAFPKNVKLTGRIAKGVQDCEAEVFMELLITEGAETLASYDKAGWKEYAAVTKNRSGKGWGYYIGCMTEPEILERILEDALRTAGVECAVKESFPVIVRKGKNRQGKLIRFYFNYSDKKQCAIYSGKTGCDILNGEKVEAKEEILISAWGLRIVEEE